MGSGCGSVGRAVASNARGPRSESNHRQTYRADIYLSTELKRQNKEKEVGKGPFNKHLYLTGYDAGLVKVIMAIAEAALFDTSR